VTSKKQADLEKRLSGHNDWFDEFNRAWKNQQKYSEFVMNLNKDFFRKRLNILEKRRDRIKQGYRGKMTDKEKEEYWSKIKELNAMIDEVKLLRRGYQAHLNSMLGCEYLNQKEFDEILEGGAHSAT